MTGKPGSRPRVRVVSNDEVAANAGLVHFVIRRLIAQHKLKPSLEYDDLAQVGMLGLWEAMQRWDPSLGAMSSYCSSYIWGYVMHYQRKVTRAEGWSQTYGEQIATVVSWEATVVDDLALRDTLAAPDDTGESVEWSDNGRRLLAYIDEMPEPRRTIARRYVLEGATLVAVGAEVGLSRGRVQQIAKMITPGLREVAGLGS